MEETNKENITVSTSNSQNLNQQEDAALKAAALFFKDELMPYLGIEGKVVGIGPTETVHVDLKKYYQDFNFIMANGTWKHFEFQSTDKGVKDLKRFRVYESNTSYLYDVDVTTYVLYSGKIESPITELICGINTYRVQPIIMSGKNAAEVLETLQKKLEGKEIITKEDLLPLVLCPLMGGKITQKDRFIEAYKITKRITTFDTESIQKIEAVLYIMADKFLDNIEMEEVREEIRMTKLGQMIYEDGLSQGVLLGKSQSLIEVYKELGKDRATVVEIVMNKLGLTHEEAEENMRRYYD